MLKIKSFLYKVNERFRSNIRERLKGELYLLTFKSYWHYKISKQKLEKVNEDYFFTARPHKYAGIGHQIANWISGYWWAKQFGLRFVHIPFPSPDWEKFLGFGEDEISILDLLNKGYKEIKLPLFDQFNFQDIERTKQIMQSYSGEKIIFVCEQDQAYDEQYGVIKDIQQKFYAAESRNNQKLIYKKEDINIAIHVRRGDIAIGKKNRNLNLLMRWQDNEYFINVLNNVLTLLKDKKRVSVYLFSQGEEGDFDDFKQFHNIHYCLNMNAYESFLHMVYADILITSKSSFSYKPALLNKGIKICPKEFWHGYPISEKWILSDNMGNFELSGNKI